MEKIKKVIWFVSALTIFLTNSIAFSQDKAVKISYSQDAKGFTFKAKNNTNVQQELTLTIIPTNLKGYKNPIKKLIPADSTVEMIKLFFIPNKRAKFRYTTKYVEKKTDQEKMEYIKRLEKKAVPEIDDINNGIIVFSRDGCPRCHFTTSYLLDNDIDFIFVDTSTNNDQNRYMWELLKIENPQLKTFTMPVVIVDGQISYDIEDLKEFVSNLNQK